VPADREHQGRFLVLSLRASLTRSDQDGRGAAIVAQLRQESPEFESVWNQHEVAAHTDTHKTIVHQGLGNIELDCQILLTENQAQALLVFTASPGSEGYEKLQFLSAIGTQTLTPELPY
jgi:hypothetical protein